MLNFGWGSEAEDAERKAGHGWGMMEEDVLPAADRIRQRWGGRLGVIR